ncbi:unnamed protein product [Linum tenue]|uniref:F-box/LRR-repeat protein 15-like leucin rich repeat domain-containing protein n=1 Tax=Linum tenue TaxID=586396 RepID=A0AAV0HQ72_9ROSI|nr:unnamed protein product [Linum tenue]
MVVLRSRTVTPQTLAKDTTPSPSVVPQSPAVPLLVSPATPPLSASRRSGRLTSRSPPTDETPPTTGTKRRRRRSTSAGVCSIAKNKAVDEGNPAADVVKQEAEELEASLPVSPATPFLSAHRRSGRLASRSSSIDGTPRSTGRKRRSASAGVSSENEAVVEGNPAADGVASEGNVIADRVKQEAEEETPQTTGRKRIAESKSAEEGNQAAERVVDVIAERVKQEEQGNDGKGLSLVENRSVKRTRRWTSEEKGKGKLGEVGTLGTAIDVRNGELRVPGTLIIDEGRAEREGRQNPSRQPSTVVTEKASREEQERLKERTKDALSKKTESGSRMDQFKDAARKNAARFAHFEAQEHQEAAPPGVEAAEQSTEGDDEKVEDWPGPFSTAMKIIRDRSNRMNLQSERATSDKANSVAINWTPRGDVGGCNRSRTLVPSLEQLCMEGLAKNADAITSLECVPDVFRHRLSQLLCDSRKMNTHFLNLLACGSPSEIRIRDCSWLTEEEFTDCVQGLDTSNLTVLQLDYSGRGIPDYVLHSTLAASPGSMPVLNTLSLNGAYRLSDIGLRSLVSAAPSLRCLNLSQCSLVSATSISILGDSLGSTLQELYLNDCQSIDAMLMLPALLKFENLEVLSVGGIESVSDDFITCFVAVCGHATKELVLSGCVKLTDSSLKAIATACPRLQSLNLSNLRQLTDSALGYLANGCREIQTLKLCRNNFSDEAIAAFVEAYGESLKDLSLNNVKQVSHNTALSVARRANNLQSLDLSWCRNLADEAVGLIVDSCLSLKVLKIFGCDQLTDVLLCGHSNPVVEIIGMKMSPALTNVRVIDAHAFPVHYSSVLSSM